MKKPEILSSLFGHILTPTLLLLGNKDATNLIREQFGGKISLYFTPVAVSCLLLQGDDIRFFLDLTKSVNVSKLLTEYLVPIYTGVLLSIQKRYASIFRGKCMLNPTSAHFTPQHPTPPHLISSCLSSSHLTTCHLLSSQSSYPFSRRL